jgi:hypothetical protein
MIRRREFIRLLGGAAYYFMPRRPSHLGVCNQRRGVSYYRNNEPARAHMRDQQ